MFRRLMDIFKSCRDEKIIFGNYGGVFVFIVLPEKWKKSLSICFNTFDTLLELSIKVSSLFPILFGLVKTSRHEKRNLMECPLNSFQTP